MNTKIVLRYQVSQKLALLNINKLNTPNDDPKRVDYTRFAQKEKLKKNKKHIFKKNNILIYIEKLNSEHKNYIYHQIPYI